MTDTILLNTDTKARINNLGLVEAERFICLMNKEPFDYTQWHTTFYGGMSIREINNTAMQTLETKQARDRLTMRILLITICLASIAFAFGRPLIAVEPTAAKTEKKSPAGTLWIWVTPTSPLITRTMHQDECEMSFPYELRYDSLNDEEAAKISERLLPSMKFKYLTVINNDVRAGVVPQPFLAETLPKMKEKYQLEKGVYCGIGSGIHYPRFNKLLEETDLSQALIVQPLYINSDRRYYDLTFPLRVHSWLADDLAKDKTKEEIIEFLRVNNVQKIVFICRENESGKALVETWQKIGKPLKIQCSEFVIRELDTPPFRIMVEQTTP